MRLDQRNKAEVLGADLLEEVIDVEGVLDVLRVDHAEKIDGNLMLPQQAIALHHLPVRGALVLCHAISVVQLSRTVEAEADAELLGGEKAAPLVCQQNAVGLDAVGDMLAGRTVLALELDDPAKIVQPENRRFAAVPGEKDLASRGNRDLLDDVILQQIVGHPKRLALRGITALSSGSSSSGSPGCREPRRVWQRPEIREKRLTMHSLPQCPMLPSDSAPIELRCHRSDDASFTRHVGRC